MVIIEPGYSPTPSLHHSRIGWRSLLDGLTSAAVSASSTATGFTAAGPLDDDTSVAWRPTAVPATWRIDLGAAPAVANYAGLVGIFDGCRVTLQGSHDDTVWETVDETDYPLPAETRVVMFLFGERAYRYWRLSFADAVPDLAVFRVGPELVLERRIYGGHSPVLLSRETPKRSVLTSGGQFLGQAIRREGVTGAIDLDNLDANWYRESFDPFVRSARTRPFFWAWRPTAYNTGTIREAAFLWAEEDIQPTNKGKKNLMQVSFGVRGIGNDEAGIDGWLYLPGAAGAWAPQERVTNGDFSNGTTGWAASLGTISASRGRLTVKNGFPTTASATQTVATEADKPHVLMVDLHKGTVANWRLILVGSEQEHVSYYTAEGRLVVVFIPANTTELVALVNDSSADGATVKFGNASVGRCLLVKDPLVAIGATSIAVKGGPTSTTGAIKAGEVVTLRLWNGWQTVTLTQAFSTDSNGEGTLNFTPGLRDGVLGGGPIIVHKPFMRVTKSARVGVVPLPEAIPQDTDLIWHWDANTRGLAPTVGAGTSTLVSDTDNYYFDKDSLMKQVAAANTPVFEFNPITKALQGQRILNARRNLLYPSDDYTHANWGKGSNGTGSVPVVVANDAIAPDGTLTACKLTMNRGAGDTTSDYSVLGFTTGTTTSGVAHGGSIFLKGTPGQAIALRHQAGGNLTLHVFTGGWDRFKLIETSFSTAVNFEIFERGTIGTTRNVTFWAWRAQLEVGAYVTSPIKTTAASGSEERTLVNDTLAVASMTGFNASAMTIVAEAISGPTPSGLHQYIFALDEGVGNEAVAVRRLNTTNDINILIVDGGASQASLSGGVVADEQVFRVAIGAALNDGAIALNGAAPVTDTAMTMPTPTTFRKGHLVSDIQALDGYLRRISVYKTKKPNRQIRSLSA